MDRQSFIIGLVGVLLVGGLGIFLTRGNGSVTSVNQIAQTAEESGLGLSEPRQLGASSSTTDESTKAADQSPENTEPKKSMKQYSKPPDMQIDPAKKYSAILTTTEGDVTIEFFADRTPNTVNNFIFLAREGFYDGTVFHRTIKGFMIQGGDPEGTGRGGPGYRFDDEPFQGEYSRGIVAMANAGPNTNGSQFFIMHADYALPPNYVIFGQVTEGLDVVDKIAGAPTKPGGEGSTPLSPVIVESIVVNEQ